VVLIQSVGQHDRATKTSVFYSSWGETWLWSGAAGMWTKMSPPVSPPARERPSMAYDARRRAVVLFGGSIGDAPINDTWVWSGSAETWTRQSPRMSPPARERASAAYDPVTQTVLLFGGRGAGNTPLADTWTWDGNTWTQQRPPVSPPARGDAAMAQNDALQQVTLFAGATSGTMTGMMGDTWAWDGWTRTWSPQAPGPQIRQAPAMAYDAANGKNLLFGGLGEPTPCDPRKGCVFQSNWLDDTWMYG